MIEFAEPTILQDVVFAVMCVTIIAAAAFALCSRVLIHRADTVIQNYGPSGVDFAHYIARKSSRMLRMSLFLLLIGAVCFFFAGLMK